MRKERAKSTAEEQVVIEKKSTDNKWHKNIYRRLRVKQAICHALPLFFKGAVV